METAELFALLDSRRAELGLSQAEVGRRAFGQADGSALQNIRRGSAPTFDKLQRLCEVLGVEFHVGPRRKSDHAGLAESGDNDSLPIPWFEPRLGQGSAPIRFSRAWLQSMEFDIEKLRALIPDQVETPYFEGTGSLALIEEPSSPGDTPAWWAFRERTRVVVARLQRLPLAYVVLSDGPGGSRAYDRSDLAFRPLGKIVWISLSHP